MPRPEPVNGSASGNERLRRCRTGGLEPSVAVSCALSPEFGFPVQKDQVGTVVPALDGTWAWIEPGRPHGPPARLASTTRQSSAGSSALCCRLAAAGQRRPPRTGRAHHDRQPRRRVVSARCRAAPVCQERRRRPRGRRADARCRSRDGTPLGIGWKRGRSQAIGRFPGGFTRKIHCAADGRGRPVAYAPTLDPRHPTDRAGIRLALTLRQPVVPPKRPITDAASDAQSLRDWLETREGGGALRRTRAQPRSAQFVVEPKASPARLRTGEVGSLRQTACPPSAHGR